MVHMAFSLFETEEQRLTDVLSKMPASHNNSPTATAQLGRVRSGGAVSSFLCMKALQRLDLYPPLSVQPEALDHGKDGGLGSPAEASAGLPASLRGMWLALAEVSREP